VKRGVVRYVIDEYHICDEWDGFAPEVADVIFVAVRFPGRPPVVLLSATAPSSLTDALEISLGRPIVRICSPLVRPNISLSVQVLASDDLRDTCKSMSRWIVANHPGERGIVFTTTPLDVERIHKWLGYFGHRCCFYHGAISSRSDKLMAQRLFSSDCGIFDIMIATVAFGMGLDQKDVTFVIHDGFAGSTNEKKQKDGRCRDPRALCDSVTFLVPERGYRQFFVYGRNEKSLDLFCDSIVCLLDAGHCRHSKSGLWPEDVTKSCTCVCRCDVCLCRKSQIVFPVLVDDTGKELIRVVNSMKRRGMKLAFSAVTREWALSLSDDSPLKGATSLGMLLLLFIGLNYLSHELEPAPLRTQRILSALYDEATSESKGRFLVPMPGKGKTM